MHRPCAFTAIALVTGTVAGNYIKPPLLPVFLIVIGFAVAFAMLRRVHRVRMFLLFGVIAFAGAAYLGLRTPVAENNDIGVWVEKGPRKASFSGTILNPLTRVESGKGKIRYRFDLAVETLHADSKSITVSGIVRVYITNWKEQPGFQPGDMVETLVDATLYPAPRPTNPGGYAQDCSKSGIGLVQAGIFRCS